METSADPFNCPTCGAHDYGLYLAVAGGCIHCMRSQLDAAHRAVWAMAEDGWLYYGEEGFSHPQQLVNDYTLKYPKSQFSASGDSNG